jgi:hypothetical protein
VRKYDAAGNELWTRQFGTADLDEALGVAAGAAGVYVAGYTFGTFPGQVNAGAADAFVAKLGENTAPKFPNSQVTSPVREGDNAVVSGTLSDPDALDTFFLDVNWGDGTPLQTFTFLPGTPRDIGISHVYAENGTYTIALAWRDQLGAGNSGTLSVTVTNVPPALSHLAITSPVAAGQTARLTGSIHDPGTRDTFQLVVDWGDGSATETHFYPAGTPGFDVRHRFRKPGQYRVKLTLFDDDGGRSESQLFVKVRKPKRAKRAVPTPAPAKPGRRRRGAHVGLPGRHRAAGAG